MKEDFTIRLSPQKSQAVQGHPSRSCFEDSGQEQSPATVGGGQDGEGGCPEASGMIGSALKVWGGEPMAEITRLRAGGRALVSSRFPLIRILYGWCGVRIESVKSRGLKAVSPSARRSQLMVVLLNPQRLVMCVVLSSV